MHALYENFAILRYLYTEIISESCIDFSISECHVHPDSNDEHVMIHYDIVMSILTATMNML